MRVMDSFGALFQANHFWTVVSAISAMVVWVSSIADRRRGRRSNIEAVGFMPWTMVTVLATLVVVVAAALAIKN